MHYCLRPLTYYLGHDLSISLTPSLEPSTCSLEHAFLTHTKTRRHYAASSGVFLRSKIFRYCIATSAVSTRSTFMSWVFCLLGFFSFWLRLSSWGVSSSTAAHDGMNDQPAGNTRGLGHTYILISRRHRNLALLKIARQTVFTHELEEHRRGAGWRQKSTGGPLAYISWPLRK